MAPGKCLEVDPAEIRFTQETISLHFQKPYETFSIRDAVRKISTGEIRPENFKQIRVGIHHDVMFSMDNRRLWVFRRSKCEKIKVHVMTEQNERLDAVLTSLSRWNRLTAANFFPGVRGARDLEFDILFPQPRSSSNQGVLVKADAVSLKLATKVEVPVKDIGLASSSCGVRGVESRCLLGTESRFLHIATQGCEVNAQSKTDECIKQIRKVLEELENYNSMQKMQSQAFRKAIEWPTMKNSDLAGMRDSVPDSDLQGGGPIDAGLASSPNARDWTIAHVHDSKQSSGQSFNCEETSQARAKFMAMWRKVTGRFETIIEMCAAVALTCSWGARSVPEEEAD